MKLIRLNYNNLIFNTHLFFPPFPMHVDVCRDVPKADTTYDLQTKSRVSTAGGCMETPTDEKKVPSIVKCSVHS